jgi:hypothetical protein
VIAAGLPRLLPSRVTATVRRFVAEINSIKADRSFSKDHLSQENAIWLEEFRCLEEQDIFCGATSSTDEFA